MKKNERRLLLRGLTDELPERERLKLALLLERSPEARAELDRMRLVESDVQQSAFESFAPGFADRVMLAVSRPREEPADVVADLLRRLFTRVVPAALALALVIAGYNMAVGAGSGRSTVETVFGIPRFSVMAAYEAALAGPDNPAGRGGEMIP